jgi:hypothetical protein
MSCPNQLDEKESAAIQLRQLFRRNGYVRVPNVKRIKRSGRQKYKKGYEVRLVARSTDELKQIRLLLRQIKFKAAKPFRKGRRIIQPIYGRAAIEWFAPTKLK